jgi:hypothetical protein
MLRHMNEFFSPRLCQGSHSALLSPETTAWTEKLTILNSDIDGKPLTKHRRIKFLAEPRPNNTCGVHAFDVTKEEEPLHGLLFQETPK